MWFCFRVDGGELCVPIVGYSLTLNDCSLHCVANYFHVVHRKVGV